MKKIFLSTQGEIIIKDGKTVWIWHHEINGPYLATDEYLHEQPLIPIEEVKGERKKCVKKYRQKIQKYFNEEF